MSTCIIIFCSSSCRPVLPVCTVTCPAREPGSTHSSRPTEELPSSAPPRSLDSRVGAVDYPMLPRSLNHGVDVECHVMTCRVMSCHVMSCLSMSTLCLMNITENKQLASLFTLFCLLVRSFL